MAWKTLYVTGRPGFDRELLSSLEKTDSHYLTGSFNDDNTYLFWVTESFEVQKLKYAIGSKVLFRYRLRFFFGVDAFISSRDLGKRNHQFTSVQEQMFRDLNS
jgi:hypothetical protein